MMHISPLENASFRKGLFLSFALGFAVRLIPEVLSFPYPIGFDTVYYAWRLKSGVVWYHWSQLFSTWLLYGILIPVYNVMKGDPFLMLKLMAPLLFGLNTCGIYYFAFKALNWSLKKSLFAATFFSFQLAALRISWDYYRNLLGLGILLFVLPMACMDLKTTRKLMLFVLLSVLVVFSHELAAVTLFGIVFGIVVNGFLRRRVEANTIKISMATFPAFAIFLINVYFLVFSTPLSIQTNVIVVGQPVGHYKGPLFFFTDYLTVNDPNQHYPTYLDLMSHVFSLFSLLYLVALPLVIVGFFRNKILDCWSILLLVGSFNALITPFFALDAWHRWMRMLVYPFTFYATNGITKVWHSSGKSISPNFQWLSWMSLSKRTAKLLLVISFSLGLIFMTFPLFFGRTGVFGFPTTTSYVPSSMLSNTVPLEDVDGVVNAMKWLNKEMNNYSVLLVNHAFLNWARLYLDERHFLLYFNDDIEEVVDVASKYGFKDIYFVWWNENIWWYGLSVPKEFVSVFNSGRISVFMLNQDNIR